MTITDTLSSLQPENNYEEIEATVMETARGRWFLAEYARRIRAEEFARLLSAVERVEQKLDRVDVEADAADEILPGVRRPPAEAGEAAAAQTADPRLAALAWLDRLPLVDRLALFT